jgi:hypothetical protein
MHHAPKALLSGCCVLSSDANDRRERLQVLQTALAAPIQSAQQLAAALAPLTSDNPLVELQLAAKNNELFIDVPLEVNISAADISITLRPANGAAGDIFITCRNATTALIVR